MNATDSLLIPLTDAGRLCGLKHGALGARYRFWRDEDGVRHVFSVYPAQDAPDYPDAIAVVARRTPAGSIALWAGPTGAAARSAALRFHAEEIHIHVFADAPPPALGRLMGRAASAPAPREPAAARQGIERLGIDRRRHAA